MVDVSSRGWSHGEVTAAAEIQPEEKRDGKKFPGFSLPHALYSPDSTSHWLNPASSLGDATCRGQFPCPHYDTE